MRKKVEYSKKQIEKAGRKIVDESITPEEYLECKHIIDNWRSAHAFPMNTFAINLKRQVEDIDGAIVVQRLKRLETIEDKLKRYPEMSLYRMQDLGGCRVILPSIEDVYRVKKKFQGSYIRHKLVNEKDYIAIPNPNTGYRGVHLIYKYYSDRRDDYNGLLIEIQIRSKMQHLWATAVETVGIFTQNGLKFNQGSEEWLRFFKLVSALFSIEEQSAMVEGISTDPQAICRELLRIMDQLQVVQKLFAIGLATSGLGRIQKSKTPGYYLMELNTKDHILNVTKFSNADRATDEYNKIELHKDKFIDVVLVSAQSFEALIHAYPNYFADIKEFMNVLLDIIKKYVPKRKNQSNKLI